MQRPIRSILPLLPFVLAAGCREDDLASASATALLNVSQATYVDAADGVRLFYRTMGSGGDTVVVIHGGPGFTMDYFLEDLAPLAEGRTLFFYDQRGAGRSTLAGDSAALDGQRFVDDLEAIRRHLGSERLTILGHSWGAAVAALYAERHPDRVERIVIVGGVPLQRSGLTETFQRLEAGRDSVTRRRMQERRAAVLADPGDANACRAYYELWFQPFFADPATAGRSRGDFCAGSPEALRNARQNVGRFVFSSLGEWDWRSSLRGFVAPTLIVHGTRDPLLVEGAREWAATLPNSRLLLLEGIGHFPYLEAPELFFGPVDEFLRGGWPQNAVPAAGR
jgi:proline iminopeptidase